MKRLILLLICITSSISIHSMENSYWAISINFCKSLFSRLISESQIPSESLCIIDLRNDINAFENKLQSIFVEGASIGRGHLAMLIELDNVRINKAETPSGLLNCCYYYKHWQEDEKIDEKIMDFNKLGHNSSVLKKYENAQIEGYSALGACMIAQDISFAKRRMLIQYLSNHNFKPIPKDIGIAELILYDGTLKHREKFMHLCNPHPETNWSVLPKDLRLGIAYYIIRILKNKFWLLPDESTNNL